jgi:hypothetical protein
MTTTETGGRRSSAVLGTLTLIARGLGDLFAAPREAASPENLDDRLLRDIGLTRADVAYRKRTR